MAIGKMIEKSRLKLGWSREDLCEKTNGYVSEATIKRVERNPKYRISAEKLMALLKALNISLDFSNKE